MASKRIYASSSGDTWDLVRTGTNVFVVHTPNQASGGAPREIEVGSFLSMNRHSVEAMSLVQMIGTLADDDDGS